MNIRLASSITHDSFVDGEGLRSVIWTQGCVHKCKNCHNPQTWDINGGFEINISDVYNECIESPIERGVTLSGGEPFLQPIPLRELCVKIKSNTSKDIWAYSGFTFEQLISKEDTLSLLKEIDVLIDGTFVEELKNVSLKFKGSSNQRTIDVQKSLIENKIVLYMD